MTDRTEIPSGGIYIKAGKADYHLSTEGETVVLRLREVDMIGTPNLVMTMPAGNVVKIAPSKDTP